MSMKLKLISRMLRKRRVRARVIGTEQRPRLSVNISNQHVSAQIIDDASHRTLASASSVGDKNAKGTMSEKAAVIGAQIAKNAKKANISKVVFDRSGRQYARRLQSLADAARKEGLEF